MYVFHDNYKKLKKEVQIKGKESEFSLSFPLICDFRTSVLSFPRGLKKEVCNEQRFSYEFSSEHFVVIENISF